MESLPVVDFSLADREEKSKQIMRIMETVGFLYLDNLPGYDEQELRKYTDWFYSLPMEKKMKVARKKYNPESKQLFRGYFGMDPGVGSSRKEAFEIGKEIEAGDPTIRTGWPCYESNVFPQPDKGEDPEPYKNFKNFCIEYYDIIESAGVELLRLIAMGLGLDEHFFDPAFVPKPISTLRFINYPVHDVIPKDAYGEDGQLLSTAAHLDSATITLLSTFDYKGLQVLRVDGTWLDVIPRPGSLVVNLGLCLSKMTGERVKATMHRVLAIGRPRRSVPFFLEPAYHAKLPHVLPIDTKMKSVLDCEDVFEYGPYMIKTCQQFIEYKGFLDNEQPLEK